MKTVNVHSPFFLLLILLFACSEKEQSHQPDSRARLAVIQLIAAARDTLLPKENRIVSADKALYMAREIGNDTLIRKASSTKAGFLDHPAAKYAFLVAYNRNAVSEQDTLNLAASSGMLGDYYKEIGKFDKAFLYYNESRINYELRRDSLQVVYKLIQLGDIYRQYNDYIGMESASIEAMKFLNNVQDSIYNPTIYTNLGIAFKNLGEYEDAIRYYKLAGEIAADSITKATLQNNIAVVYKLNGRSAEAEQMLLQLLRSNAVKEDPAIKGRILANLGHTLYASGKRGGLKFLLESEKERAKAGDSIGLVSTYIHLAGANSNTDRGAALKYAQQAYRIATTQNSTDDRLEALEELIQNSNGDVDKSYTGAYFRIADSIMKVRQSARNRFAKIKYDSSMTKNENLKLKADRAEKALQLERADNQRTLLILGILLTMSLGIIGYMFVKKKHRKEKEKQVYITETRLSKKVHDEFANDIYGAISFTESEDLSVSSKREKLLEQLDDIYARSRDIARENAAIATDERFPDQLREMLSEQNRGACKVIIGGLAELNWQDVPEGKKVATYRVLQELMVNMKKHSGATLVGVRFETSKKNTIISYQDNGIGMVTSRVSYNNGLANVENRIAAINGKITFESGPSKGLKVVINYQTKK